MGTGLGGFPVKVMLLGEPLALRFGYSGRGSLSPKEDPQDVKMSQNMKKKCMIKQACFSILAAASVRALCSGHEQVFLCRGGPGPAGTALCGCRPTAVVRQQQDSCAEQGAPSM